MASRYLGGVMLEEVLWEIECWRRKSVEAVSVCRGNVWVWKIGECRLVCRAVKTLGRLEPYQLSYSLGR